MGMFDELKNEAEKAAKDHPEMAEKVSDQVIERGGDAADRATGDKYAAQVEKAEQAADERLGE